MTLTDEDRQLLINTCRQLSGLLKMFQRILSDHEVGQS